MLDLVYKWILIVSAILAFILTIANFIYTKIKSKKIAKALEDNDRERATELQQQANPFEELYSVIKGYLPSVIALAEKSATDPVAKKFIAMSQIMLRCNEVGVNYKEHEDELSKLVDDFVAMSKEVNVKPSNEEGVQEKCKCEALTNEDIDGVVNNG